MNNTVTAKKWVQKPDPDPALVEDLSKSLNVSQTLTKLMAQRSIQSYEEAKLFFNPSIENTPGPFEMKGMEKAVQRIEQAIENQENILIYGDYDVDGTTSVSMAYAYLKNLTFNLTCYVPDRFKEGYGVSYEGLEYARSNQASLMIILDCGIKAIDHIKYAKSQGIDAIVCDHHTPGEELPPAYAILNPKQPDCTYPYKELSGCGIGFKLIQGISKNINNAPDPTNYLDYVAVSTAADIVQITGENRILTYHGLKLLNENPNPAFAALIELSGLKDEITVTDLVFRIGPRINAAGRVDHAKNAVELLIADSKETALRKAQWLNNQNTQRQQLDLVMKTEALQYIEEDETLKDRTTTVLFNPEWHKGVIGIVASRLIEQYFRPTILLTQSNGLAVGSGRSVPGFNLYDALSQCSDLLEQFGGHHGAAGLALKPENLEAFTEKFESVVKASIDPDLLTPTVEYDLEIPLSEINRGFTKTIQRFGPFEPGNMKPVFVATNVQNTLNPRIVGDDHLKLAVKQGSSQVLDAIAFGQASWYDELIDGKLFDICFTIEENTWNGQTRVQLNVKDIKVSEIDT